jgi:Rieske Fe-S protein
MDPQDQARKGLHHYTRRTACEVAIGGMAVMSAGMVGFPVVSFLSRPQSLDLNKPLEVPLERLSPGQAFYAEYRGQQLILLAGSGGQQKPLVLSLSCPHLGCNVTYDAADAVFRCPCHGATFNASGGVIRGPVAANLRAIPYELKDGKIIISIEV